MSDKKKGFPVESEIVLCTVTNIQYNSVFVKLDEYTNLQGMIHISEISPGRIRNIRDFVKPGKVIVCKILKIHEQKGHIDLSLRRVTESQRREKLEGIKLEQKAEKIVEFAAEELKMKVPDLMRIVQKNVKEEYDSLYGCFEDVVENDFDLSTLGFEGEIKDVLESVIKQKIKPARVFIEGIITVVSYKENGLDIIKEAMMEAEKVDEAAINLYYSGGGHFKIIVDAPDYKTAEKILDGAISIIKDSCKTHDSEFKFERKDNKAKK